ncbi:MAG: hypothetical protein JSU68_03500, partial [Phycisphaerales bacterium]
MNSGWWRAMCAFGMASIITANQARGSPYAAGVVSYYQGEVATGFNDPNVALGAPERFTGEGSPYASVVSPFSAPYLTTEIVQITAGGHLTLGFDTPITDDPDHLYGTDFIIFGNGMFADDAWPSGVVGDPASMFGVDPLTIEVSQDGANFVTLGTTHQEGFFPAMGYLDGGPYDQQPGSMISDYFRPVDPALHLEDFAGLTLSQIRTLYDGSGGGTPIDLADSGLSWASHVRISVPYGAGYDVEIDAVSVVPEPACWLLLGVPLLAAFRRTQMKRSALFLTLLVGMAASPAVRAGEWLTIAGDFAH